MSELTFDLKQETLEALLREVGDGRLQLPEFQRSWVWDDDHIVSLLTSISRSFPVGTIMTLTAGGAVRFKTRLAEGVDLAQPAPDPDHLLLDGQQRLTSLYQALRLPRPITTRDSRRKVVNVWYYVSIAKALGLPHEQEECIQSVPATRVKLRNFGKITDLDLSTREREYEEGMFPLNKIFDSDDWMTGWYKHWNYEPSCIEQFNNFKNTFIRAFQHYQIPIIQLRKTASKEAVCLIFEKVNTGGVPLTAFELLTATFAADGFDLRFDWFGSSRHSEELPGRARRMAEKRPLLQDVQNTDFLQAVSLASSYARRQEVGSAATDPKNLPPVSCTRQAILNMPLAAYEMHADAIEEGFVRAGQFMWQEKIFTVQDIPYPAQVIPLAVILNIVGARWQNLNIRKKIRQWYWCGIFGELYGSATESRFARDVPEVLEWLQDGPPPATVAECNFTSDRLRTLRTRNSAAYKGLYALVIQAGGARDLRTGVKTDEQTFFEEPIDIHHIFPKKWCQRQGIPRQIYDSIVNKTPLSATTNRLLGGDAPSSYLRRIARNVELDERQIDTALATHFIAPAACRNDDFSEFLTARAAALLDLIYVATGRPIGGPPPNEIFGLAMEVQDEDDE